MGLGLVLDRLLRSELVADFSFSWLSDVEKKPLHVVVQSDPWAYEDCSWVE